MAKFNVKKLALTLIVVVILVIVIVAVYSALCWLSDRKVKIVQTEEADIIVVGGGTAGCVVARRLHDAHSHLKILIMERGDDHHANPKVYNIAQALEVAYSAPYSEVLPAQSIPSLEKHGIQPVVSVASMNGGGTSHNFGLLVRGSPQFYDAEWQTALGLSHRELKRAGVFDRIYAQMPSAELPLNVNMLKMIGPALRKAYSKYDPVEATRILERTAYVAAHAGPLRAPDEFSDALLRALQRTRPQVKIVEDYNGDVESCASKFPRLFVDGELGIRSSADISYLPRSYLNCQRNHCQIQIVQHAAVLKLIWDDLHDGSSEFEAATIRCRGVSWTDRDGKRQITRLKRGGRVIVSAGGIQSPLLLQRSGLRKKLAAGDEIGKGLLNHYGCTLVFRTETDFNYSSGPVTFVPDSIHSEKDKRDWQMIVGGEVLLNPALLAKVGLKPEDGNFSNMITWLMHPRARGSVTSSSKGPQIALGMYGDGPLGDEKSDVASLVRALRWMYQLVREMRAEEPFVSCGSSRERTANSRNARRSCDPVVVFPPEEVLIRDDPAELEEWVKIGLSQTDHYSGTCAVGRVLNAEDFTVKGTSNVHVVDASTFPSIPNGNTAFPTLVIAEVAAERISRHCL